MLLINRISPSPWSVFEIIFEFSSFSNLLRLLGSWAVISPNKFLFHIFNKSHISSSIWVILDSDGASFIWNVMYIKRIRMFVDGLDWLRLFIFCCRVEEQNCLFIKACNHVTWLDSAIKSSIWRIKQRIACNDRHQPSSVANFQLRMDSSNVLPLQNIPDSLYSNNASTPSNEIRWVIERFFIKSSTGQ